MVPGIAGVVWHGLARCRMVWYGMEWNGMVGVVWYSLVWCGVILI